MKSAVDSSKLCVENFLQATVSMPFQFKTQKAQLLMMGLQSKSILALMQMQAVQQITPIGN